MGCIPDHDGLFSDFNDLKIASHNDPGNDSRQWSFDNDSKSDPLSEAPEGEVCNGRSVEGESSSSEGCDEDVDSDELR